VSVGVALRRRSRRKTHAVASADIASIFVKDSHGWLMCGVGPEQMIRQQGVGILVIDVIELAWNLGHRFLAVRHPGSPLALVNAKG